MDPTDQAVLCAKIIPALGADLEETGEWKGSSQGTTTRNFHEF